MPNFDNLKKQAKQLVRWHRAGNYSVGGRIRCLARYRHLTDVQALALTFPLSEAQEIIALESGFESWSALKSGLSEVSELTQSMPDKAALKVAVPMVYVSNVQTTAEFFRDKLGFAIDFLHGNPPFYGSVSRDAARLHLRFVHEPVITPEVLEREESLLSAVIEVENIKALYTEYLQAGVAFAHPLKKEPWGASAFTVLDPDGNLICFAG
jgi:catechol 2,3-dioxygenase-like lactoylglutathione lyase family enzyme